MSGDNEAKYWCEICGMLGEMCYHLMSPGNMNGAIYPILGIQHPEFSELWKPIDKKERKYLPTLAEKLDRLCITQLKELLIPEHREEYSKEIKDILHDIDLDIEEEKIIFNAKALRELIVLVIMNREIWLSESNARKGDKNGNDLLKSHSLNSLRCTAKNKIQEIVPGSRKDYKIDVLTTEYIDWTPSW